MRLSSLFFLSICISLFSINQSLTGHRTEYASFKILGSRLTGMKLQQVHTDCRHTTSMKVKVLGVELLNHVWFHLFSLLIGGSCCVSTLSTIRFHQHCYCNSSRTNGLRKIVDQNKDSKQSSSELRRTASSKEKLTMVFLLCPLVYSKTHLWYLFSPMFLQFLQLQEK